MAILDVYSMGDDAFQNLFDLQFGSVAIPGLTDLNTLALRVQNLTIPSSSAGEYEVHYKTQRITKPNGKIESPQEFSFDIRVDRNFLVYKAFLIWKNRVANGYTGEIGEDNLLVNNRVDITVRPVSPNNNPLPGINQWTFVGCYVHTLGDIPFDYTAGEPLIVNVTMKCLGLDDNSLFK